MPIQLRQDEEFYFKGRSYPEAYARINVVTFDRIEQICNITLSIYESKKTFKIDFKKNILLNISKVCRNWYDDDNKLHSDYIKYFAKESLPKNSNGLTQAYIFFMDNTTETPDKYLFKLSQWEFIFDGNE